MEIKEVAGIDVNKVTLDAVIHTTQTHYTFGNNGVKDIKKLVYWVFKNTPFSKEHTLFVFEHTSLYSLQLASTLCELGMHFALDYQRRIEEGKNRRSTVNIIRNKIVARIFAVVERGTPYVDTFKYAS